MIHIPGTKYCSLYLDTHFTTYIGIDRTINTLGLLFGFPSLYPAIVENSYFFYCMALCSIRPSCLPSSIDLFYSHSLVSGYTYDLSA